MKYIFAIAVTCLLLWNIFGPWIASISRQVQRKGKGRVRPAKKQKRTPARKPARTPRRKTTTFPSSKTGRPVRVEEPTYRPHGLRDIL